MGLQKWLQVGVWRYDLQLSEILHCGANQIEQAFGQVALQILLVVLRQLKHTSCSICGNVLIGLTRTLVGSWKHQLCHFPTILFPCDFILYSKFGGMRLVFLWRCYVKLESWSNGWNNLVQCIHILFNCRQWTIHDG